MLSVPQGTTFRGIRVIENPVEKNIISHFLLKAKNKMFSQ